MSTFTPLESRIVEALYNGRHGAPVPISDLICAAWRNVPGGEPEHAEKAVHGFVMRIRPKVHALGCDVQTFFGRGYSLVRRGGQS